MNAASSPRNAAFAGVMAGLVYVGVAQMPLYLGMVLKKTPYAPEGTIRCCKSLPCPDIFWTSFPIRLPARSTKATVYMHSPPLLNPSPCAEQVVRKEYYLERCGDMMGCEGVSLADEDEGIVLDIMRRHTSSGTRSLCPICPWTMPERCCLANARLRPGVMVVFYAAFTSAILSTASGTLLGAGVLISVNMIRPAYPDMDDARWVPRTSHHSPAAACHSNERF